MRPFRRLPAILFLFSNSHISFVFSYASVSEPFLCTLHILIFSQSSSKFPHFSIEKTLCKRIASSAFFYLSISFFDADDAFGASPARYPSSPAHGARHARSPDASGKSAGQNPSASRSPFCTMEAMLTPSAAKLPDNQRQHTRLILARAGEQNARSSNPPPSRTVRR